jgi:gliding-associated putative ABC transporter substrate-binding component GldG
MLDEFRAYSDGKLLVEFEDPAVDPEVENRVRRLGIPQIQLDVIESDSRSIRNAYLGMAVLYEDRSEAIPVIYSTQNLEYDLTASIIKVLQEERKVVGFLTGHQEPSLEEAYQFVRENVEQQYQVRTVDLQDGRAKIPDDTTVLVIAGSTGINEREKYLIDQYVMSGGKLLVLEDAIQLAGGALQARPVRSGLENLLPFYGIRIEEDQVLDRRCATAGFNSGFIRFMVPYPYWPRIDRTGFNAENPVVSRLEALVMPWTSSMSESEMKPEMVEYVPLASTSEQAWQMTGTYRLDPQPAGGWNPPPDKIKSYTVAAALTGVFQSYFADKAVPEVPADTTAALAAVPEDGPKLTESPETQIVVVGTSQFVAANFLGQFPANMTFLLNAIDWMALGNELIAIRSRSVSDRPLDPEILKDEAVGKRSAIKFAGMFAMPVLLAIYGLVTWSARRRQKRLFEASLRGAGAMGLNRGSVDGGGGGVDGGGTGAGNGGTAA